ncbi:MAG: alpha/beta fold hydrolase [Myxococcales bacterium]|nr:alpha/beta fold hydrolase [Polyangiaceae bacterium]MDW8247724.1 alpha/beta fold hydrolase [Myxococcales bacterium]
MSRPVLVTLHGFLGAPSLWERCFAMVPSWPCGVEHRWLPGHGPDPWQPPSGIRGFDLILEAFAATLPAYAILVGYSFGARLALSLLARYPKRFPGVVAFGAHLGLEEVQLRTLRLAEDEAHALQIEQEGLPAFVERWERLPLFSTQRALPVPLLEEQRATRVLHNPAAVAWALRSLGLGTMPSLWELLPHQLTRVVLVTGALDITYTELAQRAASSGVPHLQVAGCGHNVPLEEPLVSAQIVQRHVDRWLREVA